MATGTAGTIARDYNMQMIHYLRKSITFADDGTTVDVGTIPAGAILLKPGSGVAITVAFNGATTNTLDIGPSTDTNLWMTAGALGTVGFVPLDEAVTNIVAVDTLIQVAVVSTASATAGTAEIIICYIPDNDG